MTKYGKFSIAFTHGMKAYVDKSGWFYHYHSYNRKLDAQEDAADARQYYGLNARVIPKSNGRWVVVLQKRG